jgi:glycosyltransferase involved in cell wall biosynthesis
MKLSTSKKTVKISVVIPSYNGAAWLPKSIPKTNEALERAGVKEAEILVIDDGSTDDTLEVVKTIKTSYPLRVVSQKNSGRFLARKLGAEQAKFSNILFIDTRIYIGQDALKFVLEEMQRNPERRVWTSHVYLDKEANIYARFWDAITSLAWRRYFANPRDYSYGLEEFDYFPKGTTCFFVPKDVIQEANNWFFENTKDLKTSNDDTLLIRRIAEKTNININPQFFCKYHARTNFKQYLKHVYHRGKVFVDGFLRRDGNRFFWLIVSFLVGTVALPILLILFPNLILPSILLAGIMWVLGLLIVLMLGISAPDALSLFILMPAFIAAYGSGIWAATIKIYLQRQG